MTKRNCESCTACCEGWLHSKVIAMSPGNPCVHCTQQGCAIYEKRPVEPCVNFKCAWLVDDSPLPDHMRPNECGAIVMLDKKWQGKPLIVVMPTGGKVPQPALDWLMAYSKQHSIPLFWNENINDDGKYSAVRKFGYGPPWFIHAMENAIMPEDISMI